MLDKKTDTQLKTSLKVLLRDSLEWIEEEQARLLKDSPYADTSNAEFRLFSALRGESKSISQLSRYLGVSRQAVHQTVHKLIEKNIVQLESTENNKRDKLVVITPEGRNVQKVVAEHFQIIEKKVAKNIGSKNLELLRQLLQKNREANNR